MGIFSSKIELNNKLKEQEQEINRLKLEKNEQYGKIVKLNQKLSEIASQNAEYENKYVKTGLECDFCYTTLQKDFLFCPKCGKKIIKHTEVVLPDVIANKFTVENDMGYSLITQYNGFNDKRIIIPSEVNGKKVIGIWNGVFEKCSDLEEVFFAEGCQYIGKDVFAQCKKLKKVHLPKSLIEIGDSAFSGCESLREIAIPPNVRVIGIHAFSYCKNLKTIVFPDTLKYISAGMLSHTDISEIEFPKSVLHIGHYAFSGTPLKRIELPENLYSINSYAFDTDTLKQIVIHSNVRIMDENIFNTLLHPEILCSAGSKAQLYARKHNLKCSEIPASPKVRQEICSSGIYIRMGVVHRNHNITELPWLAGIPKAATWSWNYQNKFHLNINKIMPSDDAQQLADKLKNYLYSHCDFSKPDAFGNIHEFSVLTQWGKSEV